MDNPSALGTDNPDNNKFVLELSDELGDFSAPTQLNEVFDFYTSLINGVLPSSLISGTYKLRVRATQGLTATGGTYSASDAGRRLRTSRAIRPAKWRCPQPTR